VSSYYVCNNEVPNNYLDKTRLAVKIIERYRSCTVAANSAKKILYIARQT